MYLLRKITNVEERGFTLIELLIVLAIGAMALGSLVIFGNQFIVAQELDRAVELTKNELKAAQSNSISGTMDSVWGVEFFSNYIIRFRGESFANRVEEFDYLTNFSSALSISGPNEIVFSRPNGIPSITGDIIFTLGSRTKTITINTEGVISVQ